MHYASFNHAKIEAAPGAKGQCLACGAELISKCGPSRVWHWAHKGQRHCDQWWESETLWHREWKEHFPIKWQEVAARNGNGELHIADIKTPSGFVVEFQHSPISAQERSSREEFYGKMIWVLDGLRLKTDQSTFSQHIKSKSGKWIGAFWTLKLNPLVPRITQRWISAQRSVFLDFGEDSLWHIPVEMDGWGKHAAEIPKTEFVSTLLDEREPLWTSRQD